MTRQRKMKPVVIYAATALFLYRYLGRLEPLVGEGAQKAFEIVKADLRQALVDVGVDPDLPVEQIFEEKASERKGRSKGTDQAR